MALSVPPAEPAETPGPLLESAWGSRATAANLERVLSGARGNVRIRPAGDPVWRRPRPAVLEELRRQAVGKKGTAWPQPLVSHYARYFRDGNRTAYEGLVAARQQRLTRAVVMCLLSSSGGTSGPGRSGGVGEEWLDEVIDGAYLLCEQSSWSWAAHDDVFSHSGAVVPDMARPFLDLGAGEVAAQLAWLDHVLGHHLDERAPGLRRRIREEAGKRVIAPFLERLDWHWLGLHGDVHNWNPWIHSNLLAVAVFLVDDPASQARTIKRCIEGLDRFFASLPDDGAIDEGFAYWWNGAGRALEGLALLEDASGGELDVDLPVIRQMVAFPHRMHVAGNWFLNVADGPALAAKTLPWDMLHRWALRLGDDVAGKHAAAMAGTQLEAASGLGRVLHGLLNALEPAVRPTPPLLPLTYLKSVQIMIAREEEGSAAGLFLAAKGGHNGEHHNHRDVGSVVVAVDGVPLLVDAGQPTYTAKTFGPDRYEIRAMQSAWHNVPAPYGMEQGTGAEFAAEVLAEPDVTPTLQLALGAAYGLAPDAWIRTSTLNRQARAVVVEDRWKLPHAAGTRWDLDITYLAAGKVTLGESSATILPAGIPAAVSSAIPSGGTGRGAVLRWQPPAAGVIVDEWHLDDPLLSEVWGEKLTRLRFRMPDGLRSAGTFTLTVEVSP